MYPPRSFAVKAWEHAPSRKCSRVSVVKSRDRKGAGGNIALFRSRLCAAAVCARLGLILLTTSHFREETPRRLPFAGKFGPSLALFPAFRRPSVGTEFAPHQPTRSRTLK